jgi:hypothetical protein
LYGSSLLASEAQRLLAKIEDVGAPSWSDVGPVKAREVFEATPDPGLPPPRLEPR